MYYSAPPVVTEPVPVPSGEAQTLWPSVACPKWMVHTSDHPADDAIRESAWKAAKAKGLDAIAFPLKYTDNYHLVMALFEHNHKTQNRVRFDNFTWRAWTKGGVRRWVVDVSKCTDRLPWVAEVFGAYGPGGQFDVQYAGIPLTPEVKKILGCDGQGIKKTAGKTLKR